VEAVYFFALKNSTVSLQQFKGDEYLDENFSHSWKTLFNSKNIICLFASYTRKVEFFQFASNLGLSNSNRYASCTRNFKTEKSFLLTKAIQSGPLKINNGILSCLGPRHTQYFCTQYCNKKIKRHFKIFSSKYYSDILKSFQTRFQ